MNACHRTTSGTLVGAILLFATITLPARACQVPVFRYALERWESDAYELSVVVGAEGLTRAQKAVVQSLRDATEGGEYPVNLRVRVTQPERASPLPVAGEPPSPPIGPPRFELYYPRELRSALKSTPIWSGPVTPESAAHVLRSPVRTELVKRLLAGESAVWLLVETGDREKDTVAAAALEQLITEAGETLELPEGIIGLHEIDAGRSPSPAEAENVLQSRIPLKIAFSLLRVSRDDPAEAVLLGMLLNIEDDLGDYAGEPMAFPAFGRGRVLEPLIGAGLTSDNVLIASSYLCGACSCQVKEENPGVDLLLAANWEEAIAGSEVIMDKVLPPLEGFSGLLAATLRDGEGTKPAAAGERAPEIEASLVTMAETVTPEDSGLSPVKVLGLVLLAVVLGIGIATWKMRRNAT